MRSVIVLPSVPAPAVHLLVAALADAERVIPPEPVTAVFAGLERQPRLLEELRNYAGEILLVFYDNKYNKFVLDTIRTKQWVANIKNRHKMEQKEKEEWAKKSANDPACDNLCEATCCGDCKGC